MEVIAGADVLSSTSPATNLSLVVNRAIDEIESFGGVKVILLTVTHPSGFNALTQKQGDQIFQRLHVHNSIAVVTVLLGDEVITAHNANADVLPAQCFYDTLANPDYDDTSVFKFE